MQRHETLLELVEQAACGINILDPANPDDLNELFSTLSQIKEQVSSAMEGPSELLDRVKDSGTAAAGLLSEMIEGHAADLDQATQAVSQEVRTLQALANDLSNRVAQDPTETPTSNEEGLSGTIIHEDDLPLVADFLAEACEHIEAAEGGLLDLETAPEDLEVLNLIFRAFHTIKGMSGFLNLKEIGSLAHSAENLLDLARNGKLSLTGHYTDLVFQSIDMIKSMIDSIQQAVAKGSPISSQSGLGDLIALLENASKSSSNPTAEVPEATPEDATASPKTQEPTAEVPVDAAEPPAQAPSETIVLEEDVELVMDFVAEAREHIEAAEGGLLDLESKPEDQEVLNLIFRAFHTIKGMAGFLNLTELGSLAHSAENLLDLARKGELLLTGHYTDLVFQSIDMIKTMVAELQVAVEHNSPVPAQNGLAELLTLLRKATDKDAVNAVAAESGTAPQASEETVTATCDQGQAGQERMAEPASEPTQGTRAAATPKSVASKKEVERRSGGDRRASVVDEKIKVSTTRLDNLVNMAGELVIAQLMVAEEVTNNLELHYGLNQKVAHQGKIVRELQELSMSMRMVPIAGVFQKMARLVRDLSHKAGKDIHFVTKGEDTELDRNMVDKIADPLVHMIRNSIDHGVEAPEGRRAAGKSGTGNIELRAFHQAGHIVIELEDDGKGLDKDRILKKAIDNGVVDANQEMSDEEIFKLIFHAGLSTAQKITDVSGRGVGMDVVKKNIESLRGKIEISSVPGQGTTFTIRMPLTLAIIDGQIVRIGTNRYIVPINSIIRTLSPKREQLSSLQNRGEMVMVRGRLLPLVRLYKLFDVAPSSEDPTEALLVIVEEDGRQCSLLVDELLSQQQVVIKSLGEGLGRVEGVSGGAIMGDGKVSLILDIPGLMELAQK